MMHLQQRLMRSLRKRQLKMLLLTNLLIVGSAQIALAQSSQPSSLPLSSTATSTSAKSVLNQDDPIAKALEQATNRLAVAEEKNRLLEEQLKAKDDQIAAKVELIKLKDMQLDLQSKNRVDLTAVNNGDARLLSACETQLAKADAEIHRLRYPGFLRSIFDTRTVTGAAVGFGIGRATK